MDEEFVVIATESTVRQKLLGLLPFSVDGLEYADPREPLQTRLDSIHHDEWSKARAQYQIQARELVEHRTQSLKVSHQARRNHLEERISFATNQNIRIMKESELRRADADFSQRMAALNSIIGQADIRSELLINGTLSVSPGKQESTRGK